METVMYESLLNNTKTALSSEVQKEVNKSNFYTFFTTLLEDCASCVSQSLNSAVALLCERDVTTNRLVEYIEDTVCLLRLMTNFFKNVIETISMSCCTMKTFPTTTGVILVTVFKHCKDSEHIYGGHLAKIGKQLKDLFRTCHELQITYLMILETHFQFDLAEDDEQDVLINVLQINLEIGELVQGLDVKTLAEQWKAYTMLCEKYAEFLIDKNIYSKCSQILCSMINNNIANSLEAGLDEKVVIRSLKVTNFIIKILLKVSNTFSNASLQKQDDILEALINIYVNNEAYLQLERRSPQFINLMRSNVLSPTDILLSELLLNESFVKSVFQYDVASLKKDDKLLGYVVLMITIVKLMLQDDAKLKVSSQKVIHCIFGCVPHCHIWFSMPLKFDGESINSEATYGLYEYLLTHTAAVSLTLSADELCGLESLMCEGLLGTDSWKGLFASNLWVLVARMSSQHLLLSQLTSLCRMYQKLEKHSLFANSPQQTHLSGTMIRLYELLDKDNKLRLLRQFSPVCDETNIALWVALKMNNVPWDVRIKLEEEVLERCKVAIDKFCTSNINNIEIRSMIKIINLLATFSITVDKIEEHLIKAWMKICLKNNTSVSKGDCDMSTIWYIEFILAVIELTNSTKNIFANPMNLMEVLHVISTVTQNGNTELKLCLIEPLCKYATFYKPENKIAVESLVLESFITLFQSGDLVRGKLFIKLNKYMDDVKMDKIISLTVNQDNLFKQSWNRFLERMNSKNIITKDIKDQLYVTMDNNYSHKCLENESELISFKKDLDFNSSNLVVIEKKRSDNFDFVDVDDIFGNDSDAEPTSKKMKYSDERNDNMNHNEVNDIVCRLENDSMSLYKIKENIFDDTKRRLRNVCERLKNIVE